MFRAASPDDEKGRSGSDFPWIVCEPNQEFTQIRFLNGSGCLSRRKPLTRPLFALRPFCALFRHLERNDGDLAGPLDACSVEFVIVETPDFTFARLPADARFLARFALGGHGKRFRTFRPPFGQNPATGATAGDEQEFDTFAIRGLPPRQGRGLHTARIAAEQAPDRFGQPQTCAVSENRTSPLPGHIAPGFMTFLQITVSTLNSRAGRIFSAELLLRSNHGAQKA